MVKRWYAYWPNLACWYVQLDSSRRTMESDAGLLSLSVIILSL
jgi:hypothetical protein